MSFITVYAFSDVNFDTRILKQCEVLIESDHEVRFHGVRYGDKIFKNSFLTNLFFKRHKKIAIQNLQYLFFCLIVFLIQFKYLNRRPTIIVHNMPNFLVLPFFVSRFFGSKIILDIHDDSCLAFKKYYKNRTLIALINWLELKVALTVPHKLITVNRILAEYLKVYSTKEILVIHNYPRSHNKAKKPSYVAGNTIKLVYLGHLGTHYDLETLICYLEKINTVPISLDIYGDGVQRNSLESLVRSKGMSSRIKFHGRYPSRDISNILFKYDVGVAFYENTDLTNTLLPVKLLEYTENQLPAFSSKLLGTEIYFSKDSLIFAESFDDFLRNINYIFSGSLSLDKICSNASVDLKPLSWKKESILFLDFLASDD
tara:strand:- start:4095 stop:5207 length:1113 start_codon:yes stop_codon:yes gene_type:complete